MPYLVNKSKGANFRHPEVGNVPPLCAIEITDKQSRTLKDIHDVLIFEKFIKTPVKTAEVIPPKKTFKEFVTEYKDVKIASEKWKEYKLKEGMGDEMARSSVNVGSSPGN